VANDPEATIEKAERIKRAALAPAEPSSTDRSVASKADRLKAQAQRELQQERLEETANDGETTGVPTEPGFPDSRAEEDPSSYDLTGVAESRPQAIGGNLSLTA